jgi:hypothetical protein
MGMSIASRSAQGVSGIMNPCRGCVSRVEVEKTVDFGTADTRRRACVLLARTFLPFAAGR